MLEEVALDLGMLQLLEVAFCTVSAGEQGGLSRTTGRIRTSEVTALLEVVDTLAVVALAHLLSEKTCHHALDPLLAQDGILSRLELLVVVVVDALKGWRHLGLLHAELD